MKGKKKEEGTWKQSPPNLPAWRKNRATAVKNGATANAHFHVKKRGLAWNEIKYCLTDRQKKLRNNFEVLLLSSHLIIPSFCATISNTYSKFSHLFYCLNQQQAGSHLDKNGASKHIRKSDVDWQSEKVPFFKLLRIYQVICRCESFI